MFLKNIIKFNKHHFESSTQMAKAIISFLKLNFLLLKYNFKL